MCLAWKAHAVPPAPEPGSASRSLSTIAGVDLRLVDTELLGEERGNLLGRCVDLFLLITAVIMQILQQGLF